ncbi:MAG: SCO family protein [Bacteroidota bacterium]
MMRKIFLVLSSISIYLFSCESKEKQLPILGEKDTKQITENGKIKIDTIYHTIPDFSFIDQNNAIVTNADYKNKKVYIADFFFTSCPTICPKMKSQMSRLYKHFKGNNSVNFLSHTIDPRHDTVPVLKEYAAKLGVEGNQWRFVTGEKEKIYAVGLKGYMSTAKEDSAADGGFIHSGAFILVDKLQRVRGIYDGTKEADVDELQNDIEVLLNEKY